MHTINKTHNKHTVDINTNPSMRLYIVPRPLEYSHDPAQAPVYALSYAVDIKGFVSQRRMELGRLSHAEARLIRRGVRSSREANSGILAQPESPLGKLINYNRSISSQRILVRELAVYIGLEVVNGSYRGTPGQPIPAKFKQYADLKKFAAFVGREIERLGKMLEARLLCLIGNLAYESTNRKDRIESQVAIVESCESLISDAITSLRDFQTNMEIVEEQLDRLELDFIKVERHQG